MSRLLAKQAVGAGPAPEWGAAGFSVELDESSQAESPVIFFSLSDSPALPICPAGFGAIRTQSGSTAMRVVGSVVTWVIINQVVALGGETAYGLPSPAVCSNVLDFLRPRAPLVALPASLERNSADSAEAATHDGILARPVSSPFAPKHVPTSAITSSRSIEPKPSHAHPNRQQFHIALQQNRSFFAHLVLRCARAARGSDPRCPTQESSERGSDSPLNAAMPSKARSIGNSDAQRWRQSSPAAIEAAPPRLWVDVAYRHVRMPRSPAGGVS